MEKKKIINPSKRFFGAEEEDLNLTVRLNESEVLLREGDRNIELDIATLFDKERNESDNYKIHGKLKMVFRNMYLGTSSYPPLKQRLYLLGDGSDGDFKGFLPYNEFAFLRNDVVREVLTTPPTNDLGTFNTVRSKVGGNGHVDISPLEAPYHNWSLYLTYACGKDNQHPMRYSLTDGLIFDFVAGDGIPFRVIDDGVFFKFTSPVKHGINKGEFVVLKGGVFTNEVPVSERIFSVMDVGDGVHESEYYVIRIPKAAFPAEVNLPTVVFGRRCLDKGRINDTLSEYYVHKHKVISDSGDYIMDKIGFESAIWEDERKILFENSAGENDVIVERNRMESLIYDFKTPLKTAGLVNNLGYTPTEAYVSIVFRNGNGHFEYPPKVGYRFNFHDTWLDAHFEGDASLETNIPSTTFTNGEHVFTKGEVLPIGSVMNGGFVEYNKYELRERIVSEAFHRITNHQHVFDYDQASPSAIQGASNNNKFGLYYQPHYRVKLKELSPYVETAFTSNIYNIPQNAKYFPSDGQWRWRDVYDHGFIDTDGNGTNFPFMNNTHYVKNDINFYLRNEVTFNNKKDGNKIFTKIKINC
jgi:hypothetical protein